MDEVCKHLEAVTRGDIQYLIANVPPGTSKSSITSVFWPAWVWGPERRPDTKWIFTSYAATVSRRDAIRCRQLIESDWYREQWGRLRPDDDSPWTATFYTNTAGGSRLSISVGGQITGFHADFQVVDDPVKPLDAGAVSGKALEECLEWWNTTMSTRQTDPATTARVIIMQRLHEGDLAGEMAKTGEYEHLRLPMRFEPKDACRTSIGGDWRTEEGELLAPQRFTEKAVRALEKALGPIGAAAQLQQHPSPAKGAIFDRAWMVHRWKVLPAGLYLLQSWDMRFKEASDSGDWVVGQVWGVKGGQFYLVDQIRGRFGFNETVAAIKDLSRKWPRARLKLVENKANGPAVVATLKRKIPGLLLVEPEGGKVARANAVTGLWEAGDVLIPEEAEWVGEYVEELVGFPKRKHDDQVDSTTQALLRLSLRAPGRYVEAMKEAANG